MKDFIYREGGFENTLSTYSVVAGLWSCMYSLGEVIGPFLGGFLMQNYGFPTTASVMASMTFVLVRVFFFVKVIESIKLFVNFFFFHRR